MKPIQNFSKTLITLLLILSFQLAAQDLPNVVILATGGTIAGSAETNAQAGYSSGEVGVEVLINAVPELKNIANVTGEQISNIGSQDMNEGVWLKLAKRINELVKKDDVDGIVITHGTDTMEETAYFLNLTVKCKKKPVVLTSSMRPSTALSADGPLNIYNAVAIAGDKDAADRGVLVAANDKILSGREVWKTSSTDVETFKSPGYGLIGTVHYGVTKYYRRPIALHTYQSEFSTDGVDKLPKVNIIYMHATATGELIDDAVENGAKGIVIAGVGNGNMTEAAVKSLSAAVKKGVVCVRSSRVPTGYIARNVELDDDALGFLASYQLNPQKARVLLELALLKTKDPKVIQEYFAKY